MTQKYFRRIFNDMKGSSRISIYLYLYYIFMYEKADIETVYTLNSHYIT